MCAETGNQKDTEPEDRKYTEAVLSILAAFNTLFENLDSADMSSMFEPLMLTEDVFVEHFNKHVAKLAASAISRDELKKLILDGRISDLSALGIRAAYFKMLDNELAPIEGPDQLVLH